MITKAVIALILFSLTSSANAMTVLFKDYKAASNDEKAFYLLYLDGVREGITELNVVLEQKRQRPLFCLPDKLALTVGQAEEIMMRQAEKITDPDQVPVGLLLAQGLQNTFPCNEKLSQGSITMMGARNSFGPLLATRNQQHHPRSPSRGLLAQILLRGWEGVVRAFLIAMAIVLGGCTAQRSTAQYTRTDNRTVDAAEEQATLAHVRAKEPERPIQPIITGAKNVLSPMPAWRGMVTFMRRSDSAS